MSTGRDDSGRDGAPRRQDELDPELIKLPRAPLPIGMVTCAVVVVLSVVFAVRINPDRRFAGSGKATPITVDGVAEGKVEADAFVEITADLERSQAVRAKKSPRASGIRLAPAVGSGDRLWVAVSGDAWSTPTLDGRYVGRLRRLDDLRFGAELRQERSGRRAVFVSGTELRRVLETSSLEAVSVSGVRFEVPGAAEIELEIISPTWADVVATFNTRLPDVQAWSTALAAAEISTDLAPTPHPGGWGATFRVMAPDAVAATTKKLEAAQLWAARVDAVKVRAEGQRSDWKVSADGLTFGDEKILGEGPIPWSAVEVAAIMTERRPPADAMVLLVGETPDQYWYVLPLYVAFAGFIALFGWGFVRSLRREVAFRAAAAPSPSES